MSFTNLSICPFCNDEMKLSHNTNKPHSLIFYINLMIDKDKCEIVIILFCNSFSDLHSIINDTILKYFVQNNNCEKHKVKYVYHCVNDEVAFSIQYSSFLQMFESNIRHFYFNNYYQKQYIY